MRAEKTTLISNNPLLNTIQRQMRPYPDVGHRGKLPAVSMVMPRVRVGSYHRTILVVIQGRHVVALGHPCPMTRFTSRTPQPPSLTTPRNRLIRVLMHRTTCIDMTSAPLLLGPPYLSATRSSPHPFPRSSSHTAPHPTLLRYTVPTPCHTCANLWSFTLRLAAKSRGWGPRKPVRMLQGSGSLRCTERCSICVKPRRSWRLNSRAWRGRSRSPAKRETRPPWKRPTFANSSLRVSTEGSGKLPS